MPLNPSEVMRCKAELGYHLLTNNSEPYIGIASLWDQILVPFLEEGSDTTSSSAIVASTAPTPQSLVLASATGFSPNDVVYIDVDSRQESATIQSVTGNTISVLISLDHSGTYPVTVEGGITVVRSILRELSAITVGRGGQVGTISDLKSRVGIKKVEDVEFFGGGSTLASQGIDPLAQVVQLREFWRDELAAAFGIDRLNGKSAGGGGGISVY